MALTIVSIIVTGVICSGIVYVMVWHFRRRRLYELASKFEGPPTLPIIGNAHMFTGDNERILSNLNNLINSYPSPVRAWLGPDLFLITTDPEQIKTVCTSPKTLEKGQMMRHFCCPWGGDGLLTGPVSTWKVRRKLIQPTFNARILNSFVEVFSIQCKIFVDRIEKNLNGPEFEMFHLVASCTLDMICETAMGVKIEAQTNRNCHYVDAAQEVIGCMIKRVFSIWLHPDLIFYVSPTGRIQQKCIKYLHEFTDNVIKKKKSQLLERNGKPDTINDKVTSRPREKKVFLDYLMTLPDGSVGLSDEELRDEVDTMVFTGNDTIAITNTYLMLMLASHPDIQEKVYRELYEIYGDDDIEEHPVTSEDLPRMKYLERTIRETMRLFPVAPFIVREVTEDLNIGDHTLPRGSTVAIGILGVQRSEKYWPDPLKFDPDRFLPGKIAKRHPYAFMAFSGGPRNCIGLNYALMAMKTLTATVLRRYVLIKDNIVPIKDIRLKMNIALETVEPIKIRIERRKRN